MTRQSTSKVYFVDIDGKRDDGVLSRLERLCLAAGLSDVVDPGDVVAVKLHFGELGNTRMLRPQFLKVIVRLIKEQGALPFLTDCNTLFYRNRYNAVLHLETAWFNGYDHAGMGAPVIVADGLRGLDYRRVRYRADLLEVKVGAAIYEADKLVTVTHFKGHDQSGFGGIIKNLGMGAIARSGKLALHSASKPTIDRARCHGCGACLEVCAWQAIRRDREGLFVEAESCAVCGNCVAVCSRKAIDFAWDMDIMDFQKRLVESCAAVLANKQGRAFYVSFLVDITAFCDCRSWSPLPLVGDIGILAGCDPVSVEQASLDFVEQKIKEVHGNKTLSDFTGVDGELMLTYAEQLGLGSRRYELVPV
ncbi:MAG: DUF362 domain-containing protein [Syntrophothermus sp.]|uniref:DUF362 domain-containing protein n=1 Tax=Syntrophothermus sp. TaxID=2736299 RepID=UPI0025796679|nr:DUF362 domain-containing protein [Syntrophothermus sp.]NSW83299.1 DUF362 domain-containing protein [Syntrophothermus sp.]